MSGERYTPFYPLGESARPQPRFNPEIFLETPADRVMRSRMNRRDFGEVVLKGAAAGVIGTFLLGEISSQSTPERGLDRADFLELRRQARRDRVLHDATDDPGYFATAHESPEEIVEINVLYEDDQDAFIVAHDRNVASQFRRSGIDQDQLFETVLAKTIAVGKDPGIDLKGFHSMEETTRLMDQINAIVPNDVRFLVSSRNYDLLDVIPAQDNMIKMYSVGQEDAWTRFTNFLDGDYSMLEDVVYNHLPQAHARGELGMCGIAIQESLITPRLIRGCRENGLTSLAWTIDDPSRMNDVLRWGVTIINSNRRDLLEQIGADTDESLSDHHP